MVRQPDKLINKNIDKWSTAHKKSNWNANASISFTQWWQINIGHRNHIKEAESIIFS